MVNRSRPQALALLGYKNSMKLSQLQFQNINGRQNHLLNVRGCILRYRTSVWLPVNFSLRKVSKSLQQSSALRLSAVCQVTLGSALKLTVVSNKPNPLTRIKVSSGLPLDLYYKLFNYTLFDRALLSKLFLTLTFLNSFSLSRSHIRKQGTRQVNSILTYFLKRHL